MSSLDPPVSSRSQRRLAAIMSADIAGYSRMVGRDEEGTVALVTEQLAKIAGPIVTQHDGQIFKTVGDGFLAIFKSSLDAVRCALAFQEEVGKQNASLAEGQRLRYRIGINVGDVIATDNDDYYGDSVNIAARIQTAADAGGICVARSVYDQVKNRLNCSYVSLGAEKFKNIADPIVVYKVLAGTIRMPLISRKRFMATAALVLLVAGGSFAWVEQAELRQFVEDTIPIMVGDHSGSATASARPPEPTEDPAAQRQGNIFKRMTAAMQSDRFGWRTIERLAIDAGVTEGEAHEILAAHSKEVVLGKSRDGKLLARLAEH